MSDQKDLEILLDEINAIANENIKRCDIPFEIYIYEAERLHTRATEDLAQLSAINMPGDLIDKLLARTKALSRAQLNWVEQSNKKKEAMQKWKTAEPKFKKLRSELIKSFQFAFRKSEFLLEKLEHIKKGNSYADMIMDLGRLSVLGKENSELLTAINFDLSLLNIATKESERMAELRTNIGSRMYVKDEKQIIRNKAFTLLKKCVDEVRSYGQFAFNDNPDIAKAYSSNYRREKQREYRKRCKMNQSNQNTDISAS